MPLCGPRWDEGVTFSAEQSVAVAADVASALQYLHNSSVCHGDVYAHNVLVDEGATRATLCDFGGCGPGHWAGDGDGAGPG